MIPGHLALVIACDASPAQTRLTPLISGLHVDVDAPVPDFARRTLQDDPAKYPCESLKTLSLGLQILARKAWDILAGIFGDD